MREQRKAFQEGFLNIRIMLSLLFILLGLAAPVCATDQVVFYHTDPAGTPLVMTDSSGAVIWQADYRPFGEEQAINATATGNENHFIGKEKDKETGLQYFGAHYMDNRIGRFTSVDPVGAVDPKNSKTNEKILLNPQRLNSYAYALNNPYRYVDPDGRDVAIAVDPGGASGFGHATLYFQDKNGGWHSYDQGADGDNIKSGGNLAILMGKTVPAGVTIEPVSGPPDGSIRYKTTSYQDTKITESAYKSQKDHSIGLIKYNAYTNNCKDAAINVVNESGAWVNIPKSREYITPNGWYRAIKSETIKEGM